MYLYRLAELDHLIYSGVVLLYALDRLKLYALIGMLNSILVVILNLTIRLAHKVDRFAAQLRHCTVNGVLISIVAQNSNLNSDVVLLVTIKPVCRIHGQFLSANLL